jgi:hypothetical protein
VISKARAGANLPRPLIARSAADFTGAWRAIFAGGKSSRGAKRGLAVTAKFHAPPIRDLRLLADTQKIKERGIKGRLRGWTFYVRLRSAAADKISRGRPSRPGFPGSARWIEKLSGSRYRAAPQHRIKLSYDTNGPLETCYGELLASNY